MTIESQIPIGWRLNSANFKNPKRKGKVVLCRDAAGREWFDSLNEAEQDSAELYVHGYGDDLNAAIANAVEQIGLLVLDRGQS